MAIFAKKPKVTKIELYPGSEEERETINLIANDIADSTGSSKSQVILGEFLEAHTPKTAQGKAFLIHLTRDGGSVREMLASLCARMAAGINWRPAYSNGREILEFVDSAMLSNNIRVDWCNSAHHHMVNSFDSVVGAVKDAAKRAEEAGDPDTRNLQREAEYGEALLREFRCAQKEGCDEPAANLTRFMLANWRALSEVQMVWRCLASLCDASKYWPDTIEENRQIIHVRGARIAKLRLDAIDLVDRVTIEWEREEAERSGSGR